jgi:hypothetical protein
MNEGNICPALVYQSFNKLSLQLNEGHCDAKTGGGRGGKNEKVQSAGSK